MPIILSITQLYCKGLCLGSVSGILVTDSSLECGEECRANQDCLWFSYDTSDKVCTLTEDCAFIDETCVTCSHSERPCVSEPHVPGTWTVNRRV